MVVHNEDSSPDRHILSRKRSDCAAFARLEYRWLPVKRAETTVASCTELVRRVSGVSCQGTARSSTVQ